MFIYKYSWSSFESLLLLSCLSVPFVNGRRAGLQPSHQDCLRDGCTGWGRGGVTEDRGRAFEFAPQGSI